MAKNKTTVYDVGLALRRRWPVFADATHLYDACEVVLGEHRRVVVDVHHLYIHHGNPCQGWLSTVNSVDLQGVAGHLRMDKASENAFISS